MFGRVLVVAGSRGMSGAAVLCGSAALRGGAGLVYVATTLDVWPIVASANPCYLTSPLPSDELGRLSEQARSALQDLVHGKDVAAVGPGLGQAAAVTDAVVSLLARDDLPLVLDADGLNSIVQHQEHLKGRKAPLILTPHPGEFARLLHCTVPDVQSRRQELAVEFARQNGLILVLNGHQTVVTDGQRVYLNTTGNPGMATGGTGDVLTGLTAALLGQRLGPFEAAQLAVYLHGLAGDLARDSVGEVSLVATDLIDYLPQAVLQHTKHDVGA
jgi:NAD(P)H-hydrate epimerase